MMLSANVDLSLESYTYSLMAAVVNTLNNHDVSLNRSDQINQHVTQWVFITHSPVTTSINTPLPLHMAPQYDILHGGYRHRHYCNCWG